MAIKIPSFRSLVKNEVFIRETVYNAGGVAVPMEEIITLRKYVLPSPKQLIDYAENVARV